MKKKLITLAVAAALLFTANSCHDRGTLPDTAYPSFSGEQAVSIDSYTLDAMEPFISKDGNYLFFNSINDGEDTCLYYAARQSDTAFSAPAKITGVNGTPPHLDAVASMDSLHAFYFISTRDYPAVIENLQFGRFNDGAVTGVAPLPGDFYISEPAGWLIMDAEISGDGESLYYVNARFSGRAFPDEAKIGLAKKSGTLFVKDSLSGTIIKNINNEAYLVYAPCISPDSLELYFTRIRKGATATEICVSVRSGVTASFSVPKSLTLQGDTPEAPSMTADGSRIYYHKKNKGGVYQIYTKTRK